MSDQNGGPATFSELLSGQGPTAATCRRCGETATMRVRVQVQEKKTGRSAGAGKGIATHAADMCERCAVQLFAQVRKVMR